MNFTRTASASRLGFCTRGWHARRRILEATTPDTELPGEEQEAEPALRRGRKGRLIVGRHWDRIPVNAR